MRLPILGGGVFVGAYTIDTARARGHTVSVFNRGRSRSAAAVLEEGIPPADDSRRAGKLTRQREAEFGRVGHGRKYLRRFTR